MNRRTFLKSVTICGITLPLISFGKTSTTPTPINPELADLYAFCERQTILHPVKGEIPFKLYPFQKQILKEIHENDFAIFIKARQIGMTYLLCAYAAWTQNRMGKKNVNVYGGMPNFGMMQTWSDRMERFGGHWPGDEYPCQWPSPEYYNLTFLDELNWDGTKSNENWYAPAGLSRGGEPYRSIQEHTDYEKFLFMLNKEYNWGGYLHDQPSKGKLIIAGTPDTYGNMYRTVRVHRFGTIRGYKRFFYPWNKCTELWPPEREELTRIMLGDKQAQAELDAVI